MSESSLTSLLREFCEVSDLDSTDLVQGSVEVHLTDGTTLIGLVDWVAEDAQIFSLTRIYRGGDARWESGDTPQHIVTAYVTRIFYHEAGA